MLPQSAYPCGNLGGSPPFTRYSCISERDLQHRHPTLWAEGLAALGPSALWPRREASTVGEASAVPHLLLGSFLGSILVIHRTEQGSLY